MDAPEKTPVPKSGLDAGARVASKWVLPRLPMLIGVIGLGAVVTTGTLFKRRADERLDGAIATLRQEVAVKRTSLDLYNGRLRSLRWNAERIHQAAGPGSVESQNVWARERARLFDQLIAHLNRSEAEATFDRMQAEIEDRCSHGDIAAARSQLLRLPLVKFPEPTEFKQLQRDVYFKPLAEFSRQNPDYYRAFQASEPEAANEDVAELRAELSGAETEAMTPQLMLKFELLSSVAPAGDPFVADWNARVSAGDYFENPTAATLAEWGAAQKAIRLEDWPNAVAHMQSILRTTVRTRQPYRAAYGWALVKNSPDDAAAAYPFLSEAAAAGDSKARVWVAQQDYREGRYGEALRKLENAVSEGETEGVPTLLTLYAMNGVARDLGREAGVLNRIVVAPDTPPLATLLLARLYEKGGGVTASANKAFALYRRAAEQQLPAAWSELARCYARGIGTAADPVEACTWACRAYQNGERTDAVAVLLDLMQSQPDRVAGAVQEMLEHEQVAAPAGFLDIRMQGSSVARLQIQVAQYFDRKGDFAQAARLYSRAGSHDPAIAQRHAELTTVHPCETCGGLKVIKISTPCPTCEGKGTVLCHVCDGRGYQFVPGSPPCPTCGGSGAIVQNGRSLSCSACGGTGKGKGSVIKQDCTACVHGREVCHDCTGGRITVTKECPDCHGTGARALADR